MTINIENFLKNVRKSTSYYQVKKDKRHEDINLFLEKNDYKQAHIIFVNKYECLLVNEEYKHIIPLCMGDDISIVQSGRVVTNLKSSLTNITIIGGRDRCLLLGIIS